jgi:hypothetical protein
VVGADRTAVLAWHDSALRGLGWVPGVKVTPVRTPGEDEAHSWCAGEFVLGLAFSNREDRIDPPPSTWPSEGTLYEISIVHYPPSHGSSSPYCPYAGPAPHMTTPFSPTPLVAAGAVVAGLLLVALRRLRRPRPHGTEGPQSPA